MSTYDVYKQFGRVIGEREWNATLRLIYANWYEKPYLKFIIWIERCKRWLKADFRLARDNPFTGCMYYLSLFLLILYVISFFIIIV